MNRIFTILFVLLTINLVSQNKVNTNLFGFRTSLAFIFFDTQDSLFLKDVHSISPNVLSFPGGFGNFYHLEGPGYGLKIKEISEYQKNDKRNKNAVFLNNLTINQNHNENYIYDFIKLVKATGCSVIYDANIISSNPEEVLKIIKLLLDHDVTLLGVELGGELYDMSYMHFMNIDKYISLAKLYSDSIRKNYKDLLISVVAAPNNRGSSRLSDWNSKLSKENFYDAIIIHPYAKVVKGRDVAGEMLTVIPEGVNKAETYQIYKDRAIKYIIQDFQLELNNYNNQYKNKTIWITEWNLQMSSVTGNTLLQALFVSHQLIELASLKNSNIELATFHNLAGRTLSGSMIMQRDNKASKNATFNSMRIIKDLFRADVFLKGQAEIHNDCFEYCFEMPEANKKLYYWINWSGEKINVSKKFTGKKSEYYGQNLFDKNSEKTAFKYIKKDLFNSYLNLKPYSITFVEQIIKK